MSEKVELVTEYSHLKCAECNDPKEPNDYMHVKSVEIFDRGEDKEMVDVISYHKGGYTKNEKIKNEDSRNPSGRRDGLIITFDCEMNPHHKCQLAISQHKGNMEVRWL